jgi:amino acid transporter
MRDGTQAWYRILPQVQDDTLTSLSILICQITLFSIISIFGIKYLHKLTFLAMASHVIGYIATIVYLLVKVNPKNTAKFVFTDNTNYSGWDNSGVSSYTS